MENKPSTSFQSKSDINSSSEVFGYDSQKSINSSTSRKREKNEEVKADKTEDLQSQNLTLSRYPIHSTWIPLIQICAGIGVLALAMIIIIAQQQQRFHNVNLKIVRRPFKNDLGPSTTKADHGNNAATITTVEELLLCSKTCRVEVVESVPQNLTFACGPTSMSTFEAWRKLISSAKQRLVIAAYKSSLRGKHVFGNTKQQHSSQGEIIYEALAEAGLKRRVAIRILENSPSKDKGDNEDALNLQQIGAISRRTLNFQNLYNSGVMHSKFIVADGKDFYLGSANLDWRSLNQKMEMGVYVSNCPCLAKDLSAMFELYWRAAEAKSPVEITSMMNQQLAVRFNAEKPLRIKIQGWDADVFLAASPRHMNAPARTWDLDAIVNAIDSAQTQVNIHVMDYFPMFMYGKKQKFWPAIDNAIRGAIMRGVRVKIIAAALHSPSVSLRFLESIKALGAMPQAGIVDVRILKIPSSQDLQTVVKRDRRTHKKFLVTDHCVVIGTSNWSGDYFDDRTTGTAIVIRQNSTVEKTHSSNEQPTVIEKMRAIFERDWQSDYSYPLDEYIERCINAKQRVIDSNCCQFNSTAVLHHDCYGMNALPSFCEPEKDRSLFANTVKNT